MASLLTRLAVKKIVWQLTEHEMLLETGFNYRIWFLTLIKGLRRFPTNKIPVKAGFAIDSLVTPFTSQLNMPQQEGIFSLRNLLAAVGGILNLLRPIPNLCGDACAKRIRRI
jgi:hypothetical protein